MLWKSTHTLHNNSEPSRPNLRRYNIIIVSEGGFSFEWTYTHIILCIYVSRVFDIFSVYYRYLRLQILTKCSSNTNVYIIMYSLNYKYRYSLISLIQLGIFFDNNVNIFAYSPPIHLIFFEPITHCNILLKLKLFII